jgi:hypothetical protein
LSDRKLPKQNSIKHLFFQIEYAGSILAPNSPTTNVLAMLKAIRVKIVFSMSKTEVDEKFSL